MLGLEISMVPVRVHLRRLLHSSLLDLQRVVAVVGDQVLLLGSELGGITGDLSRVSWVGSKLVSLVLVAVPKVGHLVVKLFLLVSILGALSVVVKIISGEIVPYWLIGPPPPLLSSLVSL